MRGDFSEDCGTSFKLTKRFSFRNRSTFFKKNYFLETYVGHRLSPPPSCLHAHELCGRKEGEGGKERQNFPVISGKRTHSRRTNGRTGPGIRGAIRRLTAFDEVGAKMWRREGLCLLVKPVPEMRPGGRAQRRQKTRGLPSPLPLLTTITFFLSPPHFRCERMSLSLFPLMN